MPIHNEDEANIYIPLRNLLTKSNQVPNTEEGRIMNASVTPNSKSHGQEN